MAGPIRGAPKWTPQMAHTYRRKVAKQLSEQIDKAKTLAKQIPFLKDISLRDELESKARDLAKSAVDDKVKTYTYSIKDKLDKSSKNISKIFERTKDLILKTVYTPSLMTDWKVTVFNDKSHK